GAADYSSKRPRVNPGPRRRCRARGGSGNAEPQSATIVIAWGDGTDSFEPMGFLRGGHARLDRPRLHGRELQRRRGGLLARGQRGLPRRPGLPGGPERRDGLLLHGWRERLRPRPRLPGRRGDRRSGMLLLAARPDRLRRGPRVREGGG